MQPCGCFTQNNRHLEPTNKSLCLHHAGLLSRLIQLGSLRSVEICCRQIIHHIHGEPRWWRRRRRIVRTLQPPHTRQCHCCPGSNLIHTSPSAQDGSDSFGQLNGPTHNEDFHVNTPNTQLAYGGNSLFNHRAPVVLSAVSLGFTLNDNLGGRFDQGHKRKSSP